jgi:hypothetical protein
MKRSDAHPAGATHAEAQQLLPWLAAGTLAAGERERMREHLATCARCRADLAREAKLRAAGQQDTPALDPDEAFARLLPQLGPQESPRPERGGWKPGPAANDGSWLRALAGCQLGIIAVLALLLLRPSGEARYQALGAAAAPQGSLVVTFRPATPERELRRVLQACGARLVDGPTVNDAYQLAVPAAQAQGALRCLRAQPAVTLAQPLGPENLP